MKIKSPLVTRVVALSGLFIGAFALAVAAGTWTAPTQPAPDGNVAAPINVGGSTQIKTGLLTLNNLAVVNMNVASGTVSAVGSVLTNDGSGNARWASSGSGDIPSGAIMAFDLDACPSGWSAYTAASGRAIIGSGQGTGLTARTRSSTGGSETHTLSVNELPVFNVRISLPIGGRSQANLASQNPGHEVRDDTSVTYTSNSIGGGASYSIMQPYIAQLYCEKN